MNSPISGNISISQEVLGYRGEEKKRLCLQKVATDSFGKGIWEVQFVKPQEANDPSWYDAHHGLRRLLTKIKDIFSENLPTERVLLDLHIGVHRTSLGISRLTYDLINPDQVSRNQGENIEGDNTTRNIIQLVLYYDMGAHICTTEAHQTLENQLSEAIREEEREIEAVRDESIYTSRVTREDQAFIPSEDLRPKLRITVEREKVTKDPESILHQIHKELEGRDADLPKFAALGTYYEGEAGADVGGVSAELISDLIKVLTDPNNKENFKGFEFVEGGIPSLTSDEGKEALTSLGVLLGFCVTNDKYRTGPTFDERFYSLMSHLPPPPIDTSDPKALREAYIALNSEDKLVQYLQTPVDDLTEYEIQHVLWTAWTDGEFPTGVEEDPKTHWGEVLKQVDQVIVEDFAPNNSKVQAAFLIAEGMGKVCDWEEISSKSTEALRTTIEGEFSKDLLKERLKISDKETEDWMFKWIDESSEENSVQFVKMITGSHTLGTRVLKFKMIESEPQAPPKEGEKPKQLPLPSFSTCFYEAKMPKYSSYEEFKKSLETSMEWGGGFGEV